MNFALTPRLGRDVNIAANVILALGVMVGIGALALHPQRQAAPIVAAPDLTPDEQVVEAVSPDEHIEAIPFITLDEIEYLQHCLIAAESGVPLDQIPEYARADVKFARENLTYEQRLAMYVELEELKENQPVFELDVSSIKGSV